MTFDSALLQADIEAREAALDVGRSFIVQAPAGSGKTELLIQRYLKLLATVENPEEILAITFTRKAASEMQFRVLEALLAASNGGIAAEPHQQITISAANEVLRHDRHLGWNLVSQPGRMRIQTLDALNAAIARMQPLSSGSSAAISSILADAEMGTLYRQAATLTLDQLAETGALHEATRNVLLHVDNNTRLYIGYLARMLATRDQWLPFIGSGLVGPGEETSLRQRLESNLAGAVTDHLRRTADALPRALGEQLLGLAQYAATRLINDGKDDHPVCRLSDIGALPGHAASDIKMWQSVAELLLTRSGEWRKTVNKLQGFPTSDDGQKDSMLALLASLQQHTTFSELLHNTRDLPPLAYDDEQWLVLLALFRLLPLAVTELKRLFTERGVTDYVEVSLGAAGALGTADTPGDIALLLDYQLRHLLVDEMQDTSSAQYRLLEALTGGWQEGDGRTLFCVGDPMQSIYRFRNAEVGQFLLAKKAGIGGTTLDPLTLRRNFRSGEILVNWYNTVFPEVLARQDDASQSAVAYAAAVAVPSWQGKGACTIHPVFGSDIDSEAQCGLQAVRDTLAAFPGDDIAILVRSRNHLRRLLVLLRDANIAYRAVEIDRLTDLPEIIDLLALTRALVHRGDRLAWLSLLRAPWVGLHWSDLHALVKGAPGATVWELLADEERLAKLSDAGRAASLRLREQLQSVMQPNRMESLRDQVERTWLALGGPAIIGQADGVEHAYRFLDVIAKLETGGTLADVADLENALDLEHVSSDSNARLQIMTMHRAKGLQFEHVILFGLGRSPGQHHKAVLSWFDVPGAHGADEKVISPVGPRAMIENDPLHRFIERIEATKFRHELGRLLYVACTRARHSLQLIGHVEVSADGGDFRAPRAGSLLSLLWPAVADEYGRRFQAAVSTPGPGASAAWLMPKLRRFTSAWSLPQFVGLRAGAVTAGPREKSSVVDFYWVGTAARLAGTLVHRWLQLIADGRVDLQSDDMARIQAISEHWLEGEGIRGGATTAVTERVIAALKGILGDQKGRWLLAGEGASELALTGIHDGQVTSVVLDRVRIDAGTHWIVDYKTSSHEGGDLQSFLQAELIRYRPQMQKYAHIYRAYADADVRCALYFPLLQKFVEVPL